MKRIRALLLAILMLIVSMLLLTACESNDIKSAASIAYQAAGRPSDAGKISVYHFRGHDDLNSRAGSTLEELFDITADQVPENGYIFIFMGRDIFVLMDESRAIVKCVNLTKLSAYLDEADARMSAQFKQASSDYAAGKISFSELERQKNLVIAETDRQLKIALQCKALSELALSACNLEDPYDKDVINTWHYLTSNLILSLQ